MGGEGGGEECVQRGGVGWGGVGGGVVWGVVWRGGEGEGEDVGGGREKAGGRR